MIIALAKKEHPLRDDLVYYRTRVQELEVKESLAFEDLWIIITGKCCTRSIWTSRINADHQGDCSLELTITASVTIH
jgi:hypothetical protein